MTTIDIKTSIIPSILITLVAYIELGIAVTKTICIFHFWLWMQFPNAIYTTSVIKLQMLKSERLESHKDIIKYYIHVREVWKGFN